MRRKLRSLREAVLPLCGKVPRMLRRALPLLFVFAAACTKPSSNAPVLAATPVPKQGPITMCLGDAEKKDCFIPFKGGSAPEGIQLLLPGSADRPGGVELDVDSVDPVYASLPVEGGAALAQLGQVGGTTKARSAVEVKPAGTSPLALDVGQVYGGKRDRKVYRSRVFFLRDGAGWKSVTLALGEEADDEAGKHTANLGTAELKDGAVVVSGPVSQAGKKLEPGTYRLP